MKYKYKYRFITKRIPYQFVEIFLDSMAPIMHFLNQKLNKYSWDRPFTYQFVLLEYVGEYGMLNEKELIELEKLVTFDALTPKYDKPVTWQKMKNTVEKMNYKILFFNNNPNDSPIYLTAIRK